MMIYNNNSNQVYTFGGSAICSNLVPIQIGGHKTGYLHDYEDLQSAKVYANGELVTDWTPLTSAQIYYFPIGTEIYYEVKSEPYYRCGTDASALDNTATGIVGQLLETRTVSASGTVKGPMTGQSSIGPFRCVVNAFTAECYYPLSSFGFYSYRTGYLDITRVHLARNSVGVSTSLDQPNMNFAGYVAKWDQGGGHQVIGFRNSAVPYSAAFVSASVGGSSVNGQSHPTSYISARWGQLGYGNGRPNNFSKSYSYLTALGELENIPYYHMETYSTAWKNPDIYNKVKMDVVYTGIEP